MSLHASNPFKLVAYVDASFACHVPGMRSQTGAVITLGGGAIYAKSTKQKLNATSSTEAELIGISDALRQILHIREFLIHQGIDIGPALLYQDNQSTLKLIERGRSTAEATRHINVRYYFITDRIGAGEIETEYLPTESMLADLLTKPLQGALFEKFVSEILNLT